MKSNSEALKTLLKKTKEILWALGLRAFGLVLFLILLDFILGGIIFYNYVYLVEQQAPQTTNGVIRFDLKSYQSVLNELQSRQQIISAP